MVEWKQSTVSRIRRLLPDYTLSSLKDFLSDQCKEIKGNNKMGKTRYLSKKIKDIKGIFPAKMGTIKNRNHPGITETEDIKKRWQKYTEELYKSLNDPDNHNDVITHLEPDIQECEVNGLRKHHYEQR